MPSHMRLRVVVLEATDLPVPPDGSLPSPYTLVTIGSSTGETDTKPSTTEPVWNRPMVFSVDTDVSPFLQIEVIDRNSNISLGSTAIPLADLLSSAAPRWFDLGGGSQVRLTVTQESGPSFSRGAPISAPSLTVRRPRPLNKHAARPFGGRSYRLAGATDNVRPVRTRAAPLWSLIPAPGISDQQPPRTAAAEALAQLRSTPSAGPVVDPDALRSSAAVAAAAGGGGVSAMWGEGVGGNGGVYGDVDSRIVSREDAAHVDLLIDRATDARLGRGALYERPYGNDYATLAAYDRLLAAQDASRDARDAQLRRYGPSCLPAAERITVPIGQSSSQFDRSFAQMGGRPLRAGLTDWEDDYAVGAAEGVYGDRKRRGGGRSSHGRRGFADDFSDDASFRSYDSGSSYDSFVKDDRHHGRRYASHRDRYGRMGPRDAYTRRPAAPGPYGVRR